jgi:cytochrome oxidase assembly protein ShyY1
LQSSDQAIVPETAPTFFQVARRPKWIGALVIALAVAAVFAAFGQWQLERTFTKEQPADVLYNIESVSVKIDTKNVYIISNRLNEGTQGYWLVGNTTDQENKSLTVAFGWSADLAEVQGERQALIDSDLGKVDTKLEGVFIPSEAPRPQQNELPYVFDSLSLAQLVNVYSSDAAITSQPEILALNGSSQASAWPPLQAIDIAYEAVQRINWLSAFYFLEWVLFAAFALFLWWRLVRDEQILLSGEKVN